MARIMRSSRGSPEVPIAPPVTIVYKEDDPDAGSAKTDYVAVIARYKERITNRTSATRAKCVECSGGMLSEVRECKIVACALHPYRLGEDPRNKKVIDRKAREAAGGAEEGDE